VLIGARGARDSTFGASLRLAMRHDGAERTRAASNTQRGGQECRKSLSRTQDVKRANTWGAGRECMMRKTRNEIKNRRSEVPALRSKRGADLARLQAMSSLRVKRNVNESHRTGRQ
jgi:hypothetical protein